MNTLTEHKHHDVFVLVQALQRSLRSDVVGSIAA